MRVVVEVEEGERQWSVSLEADRSVSHQRLLELASMTAHQLISIPTEEQERERMKEALKSTLRSAGAGAFAVPTSDYLGPNE